MNLLSDNVSNITIKRRFVWLDAVFNFLSHKYCFYLEANLH
ncbi:hypothetical protein CSUNSWCD_2106 [Campylobacter showae CSUNSWCD]|uniref:Uncharacterized protein n=1 Tax=Campylobacter showae CSUNSWCD TaxID=1244083 RepID=M5IR72_9BACT|nr:hypothetical protein CSUNSWCD_2106 [Campylobacter showae CSUNSWCD]